MSTQTIPDRDSIYDDGSPSWKTSVDDSIKGQEDAATFNVDNKGSGDDVDPGIKYYGSSDLKNLENKSNNPGSNNDDVENISKVDDSSSIPFTNKGRAPGSLKGKLLNKKTAIGLAGASGIVSVSALFIVQMPNLVMNQLKELLVNRIGKVQNFQSRKYRQSKIGRLKNLMTKDSRLGQRLMDEMSADGYKFEFAADKKTITKIVNSDGVEMIGEAMGTHVDEYMEVKHPIASSRWKTKRTNAFYDTFKVSRSSMVDADLARAGPDGKPIDPDTEINKNLNKAVVDGEELQVQINAEDGVKETEEDIAKRKAINETGGEIADEAKAIQKDLLAGKNIDDIASPLKDSFEELGSGIGPSAIKTAEELSSGAGAAAVETAKGVNPLDIGDKICTVRNRLSAIQSLSRVARSAKLIRYVFSFTSATDESRRGKSSLALMGSLFKRVSAEDKNGNSIGASPGFAYMLKGKFNKSRNNTAKTNISTDGKLTGAEGGINDAFSKVSAIDGACPYIQNPAIQVGAGVVSVVAAVFSGGESAVAQTVAEEGFTQTIKTVLKAQVENILTKQALRGLAKQALVEISFEGVLTLLQMKVEKSLNLNLTGQEKGGQLGDILVAGQGAAMKQSSLKDGFVPATTTQFAIAESQYLAWHKEELKKMSFAERTFDLYNPDSLAFNLSFALPQSGSSVIQDSPQQTLALASKIFNPIKSLASLTKVFIPHVFADDPNEVSYDSYRLTKGSNANAELATDTAGNLQPIMRSDIASIDSESNRDDLIQSGDIDAETLQPKSEAFVKHMADCVESADTLSKIENDNGDGPDCLALKGQTKKYKAHLAYLGMLDSVEAEATPETIGDASLAASVDNPPTTAPSSSPDKVDVSKLGTNSDTTNCAAGTTDIGIVASKYTGEYRKVNGSIKMRLCRIVDIPGEGNDTKGNETPGGAVVDANVSGAWAALAKQAKADGVRLEANSSFRLADSCGGTGDGTKCAPPGKSAHQTGWAIDFKNMSKYDPGAKTCSSRVTLPSSVQWSWMEKNAAKYGFKQYSREAWHWDPMPMVNRCGGGS